MYDVQHVILIMHLTIIKSSNSLPSQSANISFHKCTGAIYCLVGGNTRTLLCL